MGTLAFLFGFLALGIVGAKVLPETVESVPSDRIGATAFLFLLCLGASVISTLSYAVSSRRLNHQPRWFRGLLGGVVAAGAFCASASAAYAELWLGYQPNLGFWMLALALVLPGFAGWSWPFLSASRVDEVKRTA
jgi:hypothetical protein